jgi:hypothetical protein
LKNTKNGIDAAEYRVKAIVDRVNTTGTVWLGLTVGCSECHSHKYDPIVQHEYYGLFAFFNDRVDEAKITVPVTVHDRARIATSRREFEQQIRDGEEQLASAKGDDREKLEKKLKGLRAARENIETTAAVFQRRSKPRTSRVHIRGNFLERGDEVSPSVPAVLRQIGQAKVETRLDLARWIVSPLNPLTARIEANRIRQALFGQGLVRTPDDFGTQGKRPTHPLLLDWLASELRDNSWSRKQLLRQIVTSATYCQSSLHRPEFEERDPENRLLGRQNRFRIDAECLRDQYLAASGLLNNQIGGPSFDPPLPEGLAKLAFRVSRTFSKNCLLARRMIERGVRFVTIFHGDWDHHHSLDSGLRQNSLGVDQPIAALLSDLKQRGLLDSTLVVIGGEFGRTPIGQGNDGRDHHPHAFTTLLVGGGVRGGTVVGKTDDFGWKPVEEPVHVHDLHATMLHLFGLDHLRQTHRHQGRDFRLTDVAGNVVTKLLG